MAKHVHRWKEAGREHGSHHHPSSILLCCSCGEELILFADTMSEAQTLALAEMEPPARKPRKRKPAKAEHYIRVAKRLAMRAPDLTVSNVQVAYHAHRKPVGTVIDDSLLDVAARGALAMSPAFKFVGTGLGPLAFFKLIEGVKANG